MIGFTIFVHSLRQVTGNLGMAVRMSWWFVAGISLGLWMIMKMVFENPFLPQFGPASSWLTFALLVFSIWGGSLIAVVWHRFILLAEVPTGLIPYRPGLKVWTYFWYLFGIIMLLFLIAIALGFVSLLFISGGSISGGIVSGLIIGFVISILFYRMALILPAVAIDKTLSIKDAMQKTKTAMLPIVVLAVCGLVFNYALASLVDLLFLNPGENSAQQVAQSTTLVLPTWSIMYLVATVLVQWFLFILGVSILSTLYGYFVEKRDLL